MASLINLSFFKNQWIIILMQALIATSRSIPQDLFLQRENERKYKQHVSKVQSIKHIKDFPTIEQARETERMTKTIYKYKQSAKTFRQSQEKSQIKRENRLLLEKIWKMSSNLKTDSSVMHLQHQSGSNWVLKKKQAETIKEENKRLGVNLLSTKTDVKEYKKKLGQEIKEYLELRNNIRKFNTESDKKRKLSRAKSEKKGFNLKLKLKDEDQDNKEAQEQNENQKEIKLFKTSSKKKLASLESERKQKTERQESKKAEQPEKMQQKIEQDVHN